MIVKSVAYRNPDLIAPYVREYVRMSLYDKNGTLSIFAHYCHEEFPFRDEEVFQAELDSVNPNIASFIEEDQTWFSWVCSELKIKPAAGQEVLQPLRHTRPIDFK